MTDLHPDLVPFERKRIEAEAASLAAEAAKTQAQAETEQLRFKMAQIEYDVAERRYKYETADDSYHHVYKFNGAVDRTSVNNCQGVLSKWSRADKECDITVVFNSPGGSVFEGMALFDFLTQLRGEGHKITTVCRGMAASMGGILLQAGDVRVIGPESYILIHEISNLTGGKVSELEDELKFMQKIGERVVKIFETRSGGKLTAATIRRKWKKTDWWIDADESLKLGLVDKIG